MFLALQSPWHDLVRRMMIFQSDGEVLNAKREYVMVVASIMRIRHVVS